MSKQRKIISALLGLTVLGLLANVLYAIFSKDLPLAAVTYNIGYAEDIGLALFYFILGLLIFLATLFAHVLFTRRGLLRLALVLASLVVSLVLFELALIPFNLVFNSGRALEFNFEHTRREAEKNPHLKGTWTAKVNWLQKDEEIGYQPLLGPGFPYSEHGALHNGYDPVKRPGLTRVLFLGDSICALGFLTEYCKEIAGLANYDYWTMGVYGYSTRQELIYFQRNGLKLRPDVVILEFCLNDWDGTPVVLKDEGGYTVIANTYVGAQHISYWLYKHSTLYRVYVSLKASFTNRASLQDDVRENIALLQRLSRQHGFALRVVVYPELEKLTLWPENFRRQRADILKILDELGIEHYDVAPMMDRQLQRHSRDWARLEPTDHFHPSRALSRLIAEEVVERGYLRP
ncbi:SGNH/GDSL hydrolase family protein [Desulfarculus baarsii]